MAGRKAVLCVRALVIFLLVLLTLCTLERLVFDFLGYQWVLIGLGFFQLCFIVFGFFGAHQFKVCYLLTFISWSLLWVGFNVFVILLYLEVGSITHKDSWLDFENDRPSWFKHHGVGCEGKWSNKENYDCLLKYEYVEVIQASLQIFFATLLVLLGFWLAIKFHDDDDELHFVAGFDPSHVPESKSIESEIDATS